MKFIKRKSYLKQKALSSGCTKEELDELYFLISRDEEDEELEDLLQAGWESEGIDGAMDEAGNVEVLGKIRATIAKKDRKKVLIKRSLQIAASIALLATFFLVFDFNRSDVENEVATIVKEAGYGEVEKTILDDGSVVWLNSGSSISYTSAFVEDQRVVNLKGEAFFEVSHDDKKPFIVKSGAFSTEVLGTSFNIDAFNETAYAVTVATGRVKLNYQDESILLTQNQQGLYDALQGKFVARRVDSENLSDWRFGILHLNGKLSEALRNVERKYGVTVVFEDAQAKSYEIDATYKNESLPNVLKSIEFTMGVKIELNDDVIKIHKK